MTNLVARTVHVAGLSLDSSEYSFGQHFKRFGSVTNLRLVSEASFKSQYGFVEFETPEEALRAIEGPHEELDGSRIRVTHAKTYIKTQFQRQRMEQPPSRRRERSPPSDLPSELVRRTVYLSQIDERTDPEEIVGFIREFGALTNFKFCPEGRPKFAFFEFHHMSSATDCMAADGTILGYTRIHIQPSRTAITSRPPRMNQRTVHVSGVPVQAMRDQLASFFQQYGQVVDVRIAGDVSHRFETKYAFVQFANNEGAMRSIHDSGNQQFLGVRLKVTHARQPMSRGDGIILDPLPKIPRRIEPYDDAGRDGRDLGMPPTHTGMPDPGGPRHLPPHPDMLRMNPMGAQAPPLPTLVEPPTIQGVTARQLGYDLDNYIMYPTNYKFVPTYNFSIRRRKKRPAPPSDLEPPKKRQKTS